MNGRLILVTRILWRPNLDDLKIKFGRRCEKSLKIVEAYLWYEDDACDPWKSIVDRTMRR